MGEYVRGLKVHVEVSLNTNKGTYGLNNNYETIDEAIEALQLFADDMRL